MALHSPDRAGGRIAVLGAASPAGAHVKAALADRGVPGERVTLYGHQREVAVLSEYDGEARLVQPADELDAARCAAVFVCELGHDAEGLVAAAASGTLIVDMAGSIPGAVLTGAPAGTPQAGVVAVPHAVSSLLTAILAPIHAAIGLTRASAFVLRPVSDFGEPGLEELREQTVRLLRFESLPTEVFGRQLAFNTLPEYLSPAGEEDATERVARECRALLGAPELPVTLSFALVPSFFGHAVAAHVDLAGPGRDEALRAWRKAPSIDLADDPDAGATLDAPEGPRILVARVDAVGPATLRVWGVGSDRGVAAAATAVEVAAGAGLL